MDLQGQACQAAARAPGQPRLEVLCQVLPGSGLRVAPKRLAVIKVSVHAHRRLVAGMRKAQEAEQVLRQLLHTAAVSAAQRPEQAWAWGLIRPVACLVQRQLERLLAGHVVPLQQAALQLVQGVVDRQRHLRRPEG